MKQPPVKKTSETGRKFNKELIIYTQTYQHS